MTEIDKWLKPEEIVDTKGIQIKSLKNFMHGLGYHWVPDEHRFLFSNQPYFESYDYDNRGRRCIAFSTACKLHDGAYMDWHFTLNRQFKEPFNFDQYKLSRAVASRIVFSLKLQLDKRTGVISHNSNLIEFVNPAYESMLSYARYIV